MSENTKMKSLILKPFEARGVCDGSITQIVRIIKAKNPDWIRLNPQPYPDEKGSLNFGWDGNVGRALLCPFGHPGELLCGKEKWSDDFASFYPHDRVWYAAEDDRRSDIEVRRGVRGIYSPESYVFVPFRWHSAACMPAWASRITLKNKGVRVERVQECKEADARARGVAELPGQVGEPGAWWTANVQAGPALHGRSIAAAYRALQELMNPGAWGRNDWVFVLDIERVKP